MEKNPFPEVHITVSDVFPRLAKLGRFLLTSPNPEVAYPSDHRRIPEPTDGEAYQPTLFEVQ